MCFDSDSDSSRARDPMLVGEVEGVFDAEYDHGIAPAQPIVRSLTGAEEVHLTSRRALRPGLAREATGQEHGEPDSIRFDGFDLVRRHRKLHRFTADGTSRFDG